MTPLPLPDPVPLGPWWSHPTTLLVSTVLVTLNFALENGHLLLLWLIYRRLGRR